MNPGVSKYLVVEAFMSAVCNAILNLAATFTIFHRGTQIPVSGKGGMVQDSVGETFFVVFLSVLAALLISRKRRRHGALPETGSKALPGKAGNPYLRALLAGVLVSLVFAVLNSWALPGLFPGGVNFAGELAFKTVYGAVLGMISTSLAIYKALHEME